MPAKSGKQYRFMQMIAHSEPYKGVGPSKSVANEFIKKTPKKKRSEYVKKY